MPSDTQPSPTKVVTTRQNGPRKIEVKSAVVAREWIDTFAYGGRKLIGGLIPLALGTVGGLELFSPDTLSQVVIPSDWASALFSGAIGYFGFPVVRGATIERTNDGSSSYHGAIIERTDDESSS